MFSCWVRMEFFVLLVKFAKPREAPDSTDFNTIKVELDCYLDICI